MRRKTAVARLILHVVMELAGRYGRGRISGMLAGLRKPEILEADLDRHPAFVRWQTWATARFLRFIGALEKAGCIDKTDSKYPCIDINQSGTRSA